MSNRNRTPEEYVERYANDYCEGDQQKAMEHAIVKEVIVQLEEGDKSGV